MASRPDELEMISRATNQLQLIRHIESCNRLGVSVKEVLNVPKDRIPTEVDSDFLAFVRVCASEEKLKELVEYVKALEAIADGWNPG